MSKKPRFMAAYEEGLNVGIYGENDGWYLLWECDGADFQAWTGIEVPIDGGVEFELREVVPVKKPARPRRRKTKGKD